MSRGEVHVWLVHWEGPAREALVDAWEELLDDSERARLRRLGESQARRQYLAGHGLVRQTLSRYADVDARAWRFVSGPHGKPRIAQPDGAGWLRFNLSHTHGLAACAVAAGVEVGVDVERIVSAEAIEEAAQLFLTPSERTACAGLVGELRTRRLHELWTRKEARAKALGVGLAFLPEPTEGDEEWQDVSWAPTPEHLMATAVRARNVTIIERSVEPSPAACLLKESLA